MQNSIPTRFFLKNSQLPQDRRIDAVFHLRPRGSIWVIISEWNPNRPYDLQKWTWISYSGFWSSSWGRRWIDNGATPIKDISSWWLWLYWSLNPWFYLFISNSHFIVVSRSAYVTLESPLRHQKTRVVHYASAPSPALSSDTYLLTTRG